MAIQLDYWATCLCGILKRGEWNSGDNTELLYLSTIISFSTKLWSANKESNPRGDPFTLSNATALNVTPSGANMNSFIP